MPPTIGMAVSASADKVGAMAALATVMSLEDLHDVLEVVRVDAHNRRVLAKRNQR